MREIHRKITFSTKPLLRQISLFLFVPIFLPGSLEKNADEDAIFS
jgi:hypothetical protein